MDVACKILSPVNRSNESEIVALSRINHPNCIKLFGVSRIPRNNQLVIVMELAGKSLYQLLIEDRISFVCSLD